MNVRKSLLLSMLSSMTLLVALLATVWMGFPHSIESTRHEHDVTQPALAVQIRSFKHGITDLPSIVPTISLIEIVFHSIFLAWH